MIDKISLFFSILLFLTLACTKPAEQKTAFPAPSPAAQNLTGSSGPASSKPSWEKEWNTVLAAGKKEGTVVLYGSAGGLVHTPLAAAFKERYGINVEATSATGNEIVERLKRERRAGLNNIDLAITGTGTILTAAKPEGLLVPFESLLILPDVVDLGAWFDSKLPWVDKDHTILAFGLSPASTWVINTKMVKPEEMRSHRDLLDPRWKRNMTMSDPTIGGSGNRWFAGVGDFFMGYDFLRELAKQEPILMRDPRLLAEWVARGKHPITISPSFAPIAEFQKMGSPISWVIPSEGQRLTAGHGSLSFIEGAPHPNAARVFINWLLGKEGMTVWTRAQNAQTARLDVQADFLDPAVSRQPGVKYVNGEIEDFLLRVPESYELAKEIFGPLLAR